jgi:hypothetical protein
MNAFSQFDNLSTAGVSSNCHMTGCIEVDADPVDFIENREMNFNHLSAGKSDFDTLPRTPL